MLQGVHRKLFPIPRLLVVNHLLKPKLKNIQEDYVAVLCSELSLNNIIERADEGLREIENWVPWL